MAGRPTVRNNTEARAYEALVDGEVVGMVVYERTGGRLTLTHTIVKPEFRGQGVGTALARGVLDDLLAGGTTARNYCGFIRDFVSANPAYAGVVD